MRKISRRSFLKAATVACALTALTACGGGDESAAVSVAKDENGAYVDTLTITLGRFAEPSAAALFPEGQTFEDNAYTRYIESKLNVDLVDSFEAGGDAYTNQLATCVASGELPDILTVNSYDTFVQMVNNGLTYDLTDVYEEYASDYVKSLYDSYDGRCLGMATFDGRLMGIPGTNPDNSVPVLCWMRKDWLDKLGINPDPDGDLCITLDDIAAVARAFVDAKEVRPAMKVDKFRTVIIYIIIILLGLVCLLPLLNIVAISFSSSAAVEGNMVGLIPVGFSTAAYEKILEDSQFWHSFLISVERVVLTLIINFVLIVLMAYPLSKTNAQFRGRNIYANLMIFAMLFNGGMIPTFLLVKSYGLLNTVWALVLPGAVPIFNVILVMNFFAAVPKELEEAAFIDGANPLQVLTKIFIPISKPVLATVSLFSIVGSWNDFYSGLIYMSKATYYPLMTYIQSLQINVEDLIKQGNLSAVVDSASLGNTNLNAAKIVVAVIPLLLIYPLLQRYFVSGIVVGSVKG